MERKNRTISVCLVAIVTFLLPLTAWAGRVSEAEALQRAKAFVAGRGVQAPLQQEMRLAVKGRRAMARSHENDYYVFNVGDDAGFVVVSGDDRTVDILGYADSGNLHEGSMPDGLRYLLNGYAEQIAWLEENGIEGEGMQGQRRKTPARSAIAPLIATRWNQGAPYNNKCPELESGEKTVTGCVATALAQLMYYHKYPSASPLIPGYSTRNGKFIDLPDLPATNFSWNDMLLTYGGGATNKQKDAVATLMQYCGWALQMNYNTSSSAFSESIGEVLRVYFGYSDDIDYVTRRSYSYVEWIELLYDELAAGRPVALGGQSMGGGHSFVCDGYQGDDYFHINWGWGGSSDGYFRLTALNPEEQGIGGSSTLDGFSYSQDAVIGVHPPVIGETLTGTTRLVLRALQFGSSDASPSKTFTRSGITEDFEDIPLYFQMGCFKPGQNTFEVAAQVVERSTNTVKQTVTLSSDNLKFGYTYTYSETADLGANLADGAYRVNLVSRVFGTDDWQPCYSGSLYCLDAEIDDNNLTLSVPRMTYGIKPTLNSITVDGDSPKTLGEEVRLKASITGSSSDFHGNITLEVDGSFVMGKQADIPAGKTVIVNFVYTPSKSGSNTVAVYARDTEYSTNVKLGEETINITDDGSTMALKLGLGVTIDNTYTENETNYLYGNGIRATIALSNDDGTHDYKGVVNCSVRTWDGDSYTGNATSYAVTVPAEGTTNVPITVDGLERGNIYSLRITYYTVEGGKKKLADNELKTAKYIMGEGYLIGKADGSTELCPATASISSLGAARYVDLTGIASPAGLTITPSSNPNCVYLLASGASAPASLSGCNVVIGDVASTLTLTDGNAFYTPVAFTATNASYTRTFTLAAKGTSGWNTLFLPFDVMTVTCGDDNKPVDWFHSATDENKNFWVRGFTADGESSVTFDYAQKIEANTPYIIAVPDARFGAAWQMTGKPVTFSGSNASIAATQTVGVSGNHYKFLGSTVAGSLSDVYLLNDAGSKFVKAASATAVPAFRGWFDAVSISSLSRTALSILSPEASGISTVSSDNTAAGGADHWYTLDGCRLDSKPSAKGIYIHKGKKLIIR